MRLFTAILLPEDIKQRLFQAAQDIKRSGVPCRVSARDNLHLTLVFLGEHNINGLNGIKSAMDSVKAHTFTLSVEGLGSFRQGRGSIIWAGADGGTALLSLRSSLVSALADKGFPCEDRFSPHITLCRDTRLPSSLGTFPGMSMTVERISLMRSERINGVLTYTEIYSVPLE
jgi:2'-5' RNA ligase